MNERLLKSLTERPVEYAKLLGFDLLTDMHNGWMREMLLCKDDRTLLGHRGSYKTTCLSFVLALLIVLRPDKTEFFIRKTDDDVIEIISQVKKILESDVFQYITNGLYGTDLAFTVSSSYKIDTNLKTGTRGQVQLQGMGLNGSITGKHADYIFTDDIVNVKDRVSRAEREQTKRQYQELQNIKNRGGRIFNTGTPWHKEDCISIMPNVERYSVYDTGLISDEQQRHLRESMSPSLYAANYELKHIADVSALFGSPYLLSDCPENTELIYGGVGHVDAAYSTDNDWTAYTVMHELEDGRIIAFGDMWERHVDSCLTAIQAYHEEYRAGSLVVERNADKGYLADELESMGFIVDDYTEHTNKFIKISTYLRKNWGRIWWIADTNPDYLAQILDYTEFAEHDDAADSAASLCRYLEEKPEVNTADFLRGGI